MSEITREEFNAKLEALELKRDARIDGVMARFDAFMVAQTARDKVLEERYKAFEERDKRLSDMADRATATAARVEKIAEGLGEFTTRSIERIENVRMQLWWNFFAQGLAIIAILVGSYFANQANMQSAISSTVAIFQAGQQAQRDAQAVTLPPPPVEPSASTL